MYQILSSPFSAAEVHEPGYVVWTVKKKVHSNTVYVLTEGLSGHYTCRQPYDGSIAALCFTMSTHSAIPCFSYYWGNVLISSTCHCTKLGQDVGMVRMCCGVVPILFGWFLRVPCIPTCACFHSENLFVTCSCYCFFRIMSQKWTHE